jgi:hypothetical protein
VKFARDVPQNLHTQNSDPEAWANHGHAWEDATSTPQSVTFSSGKMHDKHFKRFVLLNHSHLTVVSWFLT